ncbi:MAG: MCE family protein [Phycisphaera sp.]|nr:MCE family protein [Phycisphaera sp.]
MSDETQKPETPPVARVESGAESRWVWLIPIAAVVFVIALFSTYVVKRGTSITVEMSNGYGIKPTDTVRCRGIVVGEIEAVRLSDDLEGVLLTVRLDPTADEVAREGSRFWVVRPQVRLSGVSGLETVAGPRYLSVLPGTGKSLKHFVALDEPPVLEEIEPEGLEITLIAQRRGSLTPGAPVLYRQVQVGTVLSVGLASDAATVDITAYINPAYRQLVRSNTVFWNASGAGVSVDLKGLHLEVESLQSLVEGGVSLATPNNAGEPVSTGHRFTLHDKADDEWLAWQPSLAVGSDLLPPGAPRPQMLRTTVMRRRSVFRTTITKGWLLPVANGLIGPADMLNGDGSAELQVGGRKLTLANQKTIDGESLKMLTYELPDAEPWPAAQTRRLTAREELLVLTDPSTPPIPLSAARLVQGHGYWVVEPSVSFNDTLHGAAVASRVDGAIIGVLLINEGNGRIAPLPDAFLK